MHKDSIDNNDSVLIIDDLIATGGTADAAAKLIEISKGKVAGFIFVINLFDLGGTDILTKKNYTVENLIDFPGISGFSGLGQRFGAFALLAFTRSCQIAPSKNLVFFWLRLISLILL